MFIPLSLKGREGTEGSLPYIQTHLLVPTPPKGGCTKYKLKYEIVNKLMGRWGGKVDIALGKYLIVDVKKLFPGNLLLD